jgi:hypothetical protein
VGLRPGWRREPDRARNTVAGRKGLRREVEQWRIRITILALEGPCF